jgi:hypothetical protein
MTERDQASAEKRWPGIQTEFLELTCGCKSQQSRGDIAMALEAANQRFCKVAHTENGRTWTRRIHTMTVQAADGRLHHLDGPDLPDSISLYSGVSYRGAHLAEVLLNPKNAKASPIPPTSDWISKRDAFFLVLGYFLFSLVRFLAEETAIALS